MNKIKLAIIILAAGASALAQDAKEIAEKSSKVVDMGSMQMNATLKIIDAKGRERVRELTTKTGTFDEVSKTMLVFNAPSDVKGTALLIYDYEDKADDMWIFLPALRKNRRIVSSEKGKNFMGSEFTNADMSIPNMDDFNYQVLGEEEVDGKACWKVQAVCKNEDVEDENGFLRKISWIEKGSFLCFKVEFYNFDDELYKIQTIADYRKQSNGSFFAYSMEMHNVLNDRRSVMIVNNLTAGVEFNENMFSPNMLSKS